jgi:c-di-GMP-binding flagellar brake protein YcgR
MIKKDQLDERRKFQRIKAPLSLEFVIREKSLKDGQEQVSTPFQGKMEDISAGGLSLSTTTLQYTNSEDIIRDISHFLKEEVLLDSKITINIPVDERKITLNGEIKRTELIAIRNKSYNFITIGAIIDEIKSSDLDILQKYTEATFKKD